MALKCPACGGTLKYSIDRNVLKCDYCDSEFDPKKYDVDNAGEKTEVHEDGIKVDRYLCKNCGAELCAPMEQIVSYCLYCGNEATLVQKADVMERPTGIIPFKYSKDRVKKEYSACLKKKLFLPKEFKKDEFLEGFRGIYIPYWKSTSKIDQETVTVKCEQSTTEGGYDYEREFDFTVKVNGEMNSGSFDASEAFDDTIAAEIAPYHTSQIEPFKESYLAGFYADRVTVPLETYDEQSDKLMTNAITSDIQELAGTITPVSGEITEKFSWKRTKKESLLFPVWFLTWRNGDRVSYSVMNGETGSLSMDLPVDLKKFFLWVGLISVAVFALLCCLPIFILPIKIAGYSSILLYISGLILMKEIKQIHQIESHEFDYGSKEKRRDVSEKTEPADMSKEDSEDESGQDEKSGKKKKKKGCLGKGFRIFVNFILVGAAFCGIWEASTTYHLQTPFLMMCAAQLILCIRQILLIKKIEKKFAMVATVISVVIQAAAYAVCRTGVQADYWFYGLSALTLSGMIYNIITCSSYINYLTSRPVPNFWSREGADNGR